MQTSRARLFKIFYDQSSFDSIDTTVFEPLDNCSGLPNWFEFWPILNFLRVTELEKDTFYGFFSPKFPEKAGFEISYVRSVLESSEGADVVLFSSNWPLLATNLNVWQAGDRYHPGLLPAVRRFLSSIDHPFDPGPHVGTFENEVYSNFFVAKRTFWLAWKDLAEKYLEYVLKGGPGLADNQPTEYMGKQGPFMRVFVQERLVCILLSEKKWNVVAPNYVGDVILPSNFKGLERPLYRRFLAVCDLSKRFALNYSYPSGVLFFRVFRRFFYRFFW